MRLDGARTLAWRLRRHALEPGHTPPPADPAAVPAQAPAQTPAEDAAARVLALRAWPQAAAELMVRVRRPDAHPADLDRALAMGTLVRSYAFRGGSYVMTPDVAADVLAVRATTRVWETERYQRQGGFAVGSWEELREAVRDALVYGPRTRAEIAEHLARMPALRHLAQAAATGAGADSLYKPLHWWGDIAFGPERQGHTTFRSLAGDPHWPGIPPLDVAGPRAVAAYLGAYGPATPANLAYWLTEGLSAPRARVSAWLTDLGDRVTHVDHDGVPALALTSHLPEMVETAPSDTVRLLPAHDPWVLGPGSADPRIVPAHRRDVVSRGANLVIRGGVLAGTWRGRGGDAAVDWFEEAGPAPTEALQHEIGRIAGLTARD